MNLATRTKSVPFPYFKFYPRDWLDATRKLTPEERGLYIDLIALTMKNEGSLDDDDDAISHAMAVSKRLWRSVKARLEAKGKIVLSDGKIVNERCVLELSSLLGERKKRSNAATVREAEKRVAQSSQTALKAGSAPVQPRLSAEPDANQIRFEPEFPEKPNEINKQPSTAVPRSCHYTDSDTDKKEEGGGLFGDTPLFSQPDRHPGNPPENRPPVYMNGTALKTPGFLLTYDMIDRVGKQFGYEPQDARATAKLFAENWVLNGIKVDNPLAALSAAFKSFRDDADASAQKSRASKPKTPKEATPYPDDFVWFWQRYPNKTAKREALEEWEQLTIEDKRAACQGLLDQRKALTAENQRRSEDGKNCCVHARRWLKRRRWEDEPQETRLASSRTSDADRDGVRRIMQEVLSGVGR